MPSTSGVSCPECGKDYASCCGVKKHLLSAHQLMFVDFSNDTRQPTPDELENAMVMLRRHQRHEQRPSVPLRVRIPTRPRSVTGPLGRATRAGSGSPADIQAITPPMPIISPANDGSVAQ